jgi:hypothetical protein
MCYAVQQICTHYPLACNRSTNTRGDAYAAGFPPAAGMCRSPCSSLSVVMLRRIVAALLQLLGQGKRAALRITYISIGNNGCQCCTAQDALLAVASCCACSRRPPCEQLVAVTVHTVHTVDTSCSCLLTVFLSRQQPAGPVLQA